MRTGKLTIYSINNPNSVAFYWSKDAVEILNTNKIVIEKRKNKLIVRRPSFDDNNILTINSKRMNTYCGSMVNDFKGNYFIEQYDLNQDEFELIPVEKSNE